MPDCTLVIVPRLISCVKINRLQKGVKSSPTLSPSPPKQEAARGHIFLAQIDPHHLEAIILLCMNSIVPEWCFVGRPVAYF